MASWAYQNLKETLKAAGVQLLAVSKTKSVEEIRAIYESGQRDFGENYVQELVVKYQVLPDDIRWHFIGHLQTNKVKHISPFVYMIQSVDSLKLLLEIDKQAEKKHRIINCLLQIHIAREETKFGLDEGELDAILHTVLAYRSAEKLSHIRISGCMGMASMTGDQQTIFREFTTLHTLFQKTKSLLSNDPVITLSMGMSNDYPIAITCGSTMVRIGSLIFGERNAAH